MPRDLNARSAAAKARKDSERKERYEKLEEDIVDLVTDILDNTFPEKDDGSIDWDKSDWDMAEALKEFLTSIHDGEIQPVRQESGKKRREKKSTRSNGRADHDTGTATTATTAPADAAATATTPPKPSLWDRGVARLNKS
jgi:hypothetical protein